MSKKRDIQLWIVLILLALMWLVVKFFLQYWYIFVGIALILGGIIFWARSEKNVAQEVNYTYEIKDGEPHLKPMPYSEPKDFIDYAVFGITDVQVKRLLNIYHESLADVNTSKDIETVDSRFGVLMEVGEQLAAMSLIELEILISSFRSIDVEKIFDKAADRYLEKQIREISRLKTDKGKMRRVEKILGIIDGLTYMPEQCKIQAKELLLASLP